MDNPKSKYDGMTVIERLVAAGLLDAFDVARDKGDLDELRRIAKSVDLEVDDDGMFWSKPKGK